MNKKARILLALTIGSIIIALLLFRGSKGSSSSATSTNQLKLEGSQKQVTADIVPSKTFKSYADPSGFTFNYPDNLSIINNDPKSPNIYADIQLAANGLANSLAIKISDSSFTSLDQWLKVNNPSSAPVKEVKLGNIKAEEITTNDRLLLGALDQGVLFTIEVPFGGKKDFWMNVYNKVLADFTFAPPVKNSANGGDGVSSSSDDVTFEGEESVE